MAFKRNPASTPTLCIEGKITEPGLRAPVTLYKPNGNYYTSETWGIPTGAIGPAQMERSLDFRRINGGPVVIDADPSGDTD